MARDFKKIKAWQHADNLAFSVYSETKAFPKEEIYGITSQLRRAGISVAANIAEGTARGHKKEYLQFLYTARGSIAEIEYLLHLSNKLEYLKDDAYKKLEELRERTAKTLYGLILAVKKGIYA
jgi:four helix bundle protein